MVETNTSLTRLGPLMTDTAAVIRSAVLADAATSASRFEANFAESVGPGTDTFGSGGFGRGRSGPPLRSFLAERLDSVSGQLDGTRPGTPGRSGRGGFGGFR